MSIIHLFLSASFLLNENGATVHIGPFGVSWVHGC